MFEPLLGLGSRVSRIFRLIGQSEFIRRLHDFLIHEGRRSRVQTLEQTAKVVLDLEKAESLRIKNSRSLLELMKAAGFSDEQIQAALSNPQEVQRVSAAMTTMLQYVDKGIVTINVVQTAPAREIGEMFGMKVLTDKRTISEPSRIPKKSANRRRKK